MTNVYREPELIGNLRSSINLLKDVITIRADVERLSYEIVSRGGFISHSRLGEALSALNPWQGMYDKKHADMIAQYYTLKFSLEETLKQSRKVLAAYSNRDLPGITKAIQIIEAFVEQVEARINAVTHNEKVTLFSRKEINVFEKILMNLVTEAKEMRQEDDGTGEYMKVPGEDGQPHYTQRQEDSLSYERFVKQALFALHSIDIRASEERNRDETGRFANEEGKSPEDMVRILSNSEYRDKLFTVKEYRKLWKRMNDAELPERTGYNDLQGAIEQGWIERVGGLHQYILTPRGKDVAKVRGSLIGAAVTRSQSAKYDQNKIEKFRAWARNCLDVINRLHKMIKTAHSVSNSERSVLYSEIIKAYRELEHLLSSGLLPLGLTEDEEEAVLHEVEYGLTSNNIRNVIESASFRQDIIKAKELLPDNHPVLVGTGLVIRSLIGFIQFQRIVIDPKRSGWSGKLRIDFTASKEVLSPAAPMGPDDVVGVESVDDVNIEVSRTCL